VTVVRLLACSHSQGLLFVDLGDFVACQSAVTLTDTALPCDDVQVLLLTPGTREACSKAEEFSPLSWL